MGIYLFGCPLVSLNLDAILSETTIHLRGERLSIITDGLGLKDAPGATFEQIKVQLGQKSRLRMVALTFVRHSERPPCQTLAVEIGSIDYSVKLLIRTCHGGQGRVNRSINPLRSLRASN